MMRALIARAPSERRPSAARAPPERRPSAAVARRPTFEARTSPERGDGGAHLRRSPLAATRERSRPRNWFGAASNEICGLNASEWRECSSVKVDDALTFARSLSDAHRRARARARLRSGLC